MEFNPGSFKVLIVDDEPDILEFVRYNLKKEGYQVYLASAGKEGIESARKHRPDLILLDIMLPGMDGIEVCREIRKIPALSGTTIAFLTARGEDLSQIAGFEAGGDDYITKPIRMKVLVSRIRALLKRSQQTLNERIEGDGTLQGDILLDRERFLVLKKGEELILPKKEFELLQLLISKPGKVFSRKEILQEVWGQKVIVGDRTIDVHIRKLREKLGERSIQTVKGVGYKYVT
jgi:two-component system alkaline phosphatase synthesis response regulator PhoP